MDTEALRTFLAIHREKGFSGAARALHRTQPAISSRMRLLEQELDARLFERTANGIALSQAGRVLLPYAEAAMLNLQDAYNAVRSLSREAAGPLDLAVVGTLADRKLTAVLQALAARHPAVALTLRTARSMEVSELVRTGEATIGLRYERERSPDLHYEQIGTEELVIVCGPNHPLAGKSLASLAPLQDERWLAFSEKPDWSEPWPSHIARVFVANGLGKIGWSQVDSLTAQKRLAEAGLGIALLPLGGVEEELRRRTLVRIKVRRLKLRQPIFLVTRSKAYLSGAAKQAIESLRRTFAA